MKDGVTAKIATIQRTRDIKALRDNLIRAKIEAEDFGEDIAGAVARLLERIDQLERIAA